MIEGETLALAKVHFSTYCRKKPSNHTNETSESGVSEKQKKFNPLNWYVE